MTPEETARIDSLVQTAVNVAIDFAYGMGSGKDHIKIHDFPAFLKKLLASDRLFIQMRNQRMTQEFYNYGWNSFTTKDSPEYQDEIDQGNVNELKEVWVMKEATDE